MNESDDEKIAPGEAVPRIPQATKESCGRGVQAEHGTGVEEREDDALLKKNAIGKVRAGNRAKASVCV